MVKQYLTNCRLVLPDETVEQAALLIDGQEIAEVCPSTVDGNVHEYDLGGATVMPGMIDLHCDAIESFAEPRSGIYLPFELAARQADQSAAINGVTTLFNAVSFAGEELGLRKEDAPARLVRAVRDHRPLAKTDQRVHCRFEVTVEKSLPKILDFLEDNSCDLVSYMNHSPGQGQFRDEANYRSYVSARYGYSDDTITRLLDTKRDSKRDQQSLTERIELLSEVAARCGVPLAAHDVDSENAVREMVSLGAVLSEFPMSVAAAESGVAAGVHQSVGAVNVIRGGSQRSGMSAMLLIEQGCADCLCSDYVPATLLPAVLKICDQLQRPLHQIAKLVTANPAKAAGLCDRGSIQPGLKADLIAFHHHSGDALPELLHTWSHGRTVYTSSAACRSSETARPTAPRS